ncbi:hypothetical protein KEM56_007566 [Ascosphaera pollenicola]|nr:hypothetical protein KEM56_007566 [Ascosphaera pollenicola]
MSLPYGNIVSVGGEQCDKIYVILKENDQCVDLSFTKDSIAKGEVTFGVMLKQLCQKLVPILDPGNAKDDINETTNKVIGLVMKGNETLVEAPIGAYGYYDGFTIKETEQGDGPFELVNAKYHVLEMRRNRLVKNRL